jgi:AcrR family transcriptional regulator
MENVNEYGTKERLLQAARKVFGERGLQSATVREICDLASANVAAVNYHYGGKERLYVAVLRDFMERQLRQHPRDAGVTPATPPQERLRIYVRSLLSQFLGDGDPVSERLGKLLTQEFIEPSQHFGAIFDRYCRPLHDLLRDIVRELMPGAPEVVVDRCASSIIGQCVLFDFAREAIVRMSPALELTAANVESVTDGIMEFSLGGIERLNATLDKERAA